MEPQQVKRDEHEREQKGMREMWSEVIVSSAVLLVHVLSKKARGVHV
jgi:hypothetical protein